MKCPTCQSELVHCKNEFGNFWHCGECDGTAVALPLLKRFVDKEVIQKLWRRAKDYDHLSTRSCPGCPGKMEEVPVQIGEVRLLIDVCETCQFIWLDAGEWDQLPNGPAQPKGRYEGLTMEQREVMARAEVEAIQQRYEREKRTEETLDNIAGMMTGRGYARRSGWRMVEGLVDGLLSDFFIGR